MNGSDPKDGGVALPGGVPLEAPTPSPSLDPRDGGTSQQREPPKPIPRPHAARRQGSQKPQPAGGIDGIELAKTSHCSGPGSAPLV